MRPARLMFIRHAEKPYDGSADGGVRMDGSHNDESLTVRGWQRAGALAQFFRARVDLTPSVIFAAGVGQGSNSMRPTETVMPLAALLKQDQQFAFVTTHLKDDLQPLVNDVSTRQGPVLIAWEHKVIPAIIALLPNPPEVPTKWPDGRFDIVWIADRADDGWSFQQLPQMLLDGDSPDGIV